MPPEDNSEFPSKSQLEALEDRIEALEAEDAVFHSLNFNTAITDVITVMWPAGYAYAAIETQETNGSAAALQAAAKYPSGSYSAISAVKTQYPALHGRAINFKVSITGGTEADFLLKLTKV